MDVSEVVFKKADIDELEKYCEDKSLRRLILKNV